MNPNEIPSQSEIELEEIISQMFENGESDEAIREFIESVEEMEKNLHKPIYWVSSVDEIPW